MRFENVATAILVLSAVVVAGAAAHREFARPAPAQRAAGGPPTYRKGWDSLAPYGRWIGDSSARVKIVEFADLECPFCERFNTAFRKLTAEQRKDVAVLFVEFPLTIHKFARPAAYAAECAASEHRWVEFHDALFEKQDSFGLKSWSSYAEDAGIRDTVAFNGCVRSMVSSARVDTAARIAKAFGIRGTPTLIVNGMQWSGVPYDSLATVIERAKDASRTASVTRD